MQVAFKDNGTERTFLIDDQDAWVATLSWAHNGNGYPVTDLKIGDRVRKTAAHKAIWERAFGPVPEGKQIDHENRDRLDNRRSNLRLVDRSTQNANRTFRKNKSGFTGITKVKEDRWQARIMVDYKMRSLGYHRSPEEAARAVNAGYRRFFPGVAIPNPAAERDGVPSK